MAWCYVGGHLRNLTHSEMEDHDIDPNEGRWDEEPDRVERCKDCGDPWETCGCGEEDAT